MAVIRSPFSSDDSDWTLEDYLKSGGQGQTPTPVNTGNVLPTQENVQNRSPIELAVFDALLERNEVDPDKWGETISNVYGLAEQRKDTPWYLKPLSLALEGMSAGSRAASSGVVTGIGAVEQLSRAISSGQLGESRNPLDVARAVSSQPATIASKFVAVENPDLQEKIKQGYMPSWGELYGDPTFHVTVPNIRDKVDTPDIPVIGWLSRAGLWTLDASIELAAQSAVDPLSYVSFGAGKWAGQAGRAALASRLLQKDAVQVLENAVQQGLIKAIDYGKIYRLGEFGLDRAQRRLLANAGIIEHAGISLNFGQRSTIRGTGFLSNTIGRGASYARYGGSRLLRQNDKINEFFTTKSLRSLRSLASNKATSAEAKSMIAHYNASLAAKAEFGKMQQIIGSRYYDLIHRLSRSEFDGDLHLAIETGTVGNIFDPTARALAEETQLAFAEIRQMYNDAVERITKEYGLTPEFVYNINDIDNYFSHTITRDAADWLKKNGDDSPFKSMFNEMFEESIADMKRGVGALRARKLVKDEKFFGVELKEGTIEEINRVFREQADVDFDWFNTDASTVLSSYIDTAARNFRRIRYMDKLFEHGDDVIRVILPKYVNNKQAMNSVQSTLKSLNSKRNKLVRMIQDSARNTVKGNQRTLAKEMQGTKNRLAKAVSNGTAMLEDTEESIAQMTKELDAIKKHIDTTKKQLAKNADASKMEYETAIAPLEMRLEALKKSIADGNAKREAARQALVEQHVQMFPNRAKRPTDMKVLADEIVGAKRKRFEQRLKLLETRQAKAESKKAGAATRRVDAEAEMAVVEESLVATNETKYLLREMVDIDYDPEVFPDGMMYTSKAHLESQPANDTVFFYDTFDEIPDPVALPAPDIQQTYDLGLRLEDVQEIIVGLPSSIADNIVAATGDDALGEYIVRETSRLLRSPLGTDVDPRVPEDLHGLIATIEGWGRSAETSPEVVEVYLNELADQVNTVLSARSLEPFDPEDAYAIVDDSIRAAAQAANPEGARVTVVLPDIEYGMGNKLLVSSTEAQNLFRGTTDDVFAGIEMGSSKWDAVVPESGIEPTDPFVREAQIQQEFENLLNQRQRVQATMDRADTDIMAADEVIAQVGRDVTGARSGLTRSERGVQRNLEAFEPTPELKAQYKERSVLNKKVAAEKRKFDAAVENDPLVEYIADTEKQVTTIATNMDTANALSVDQNTWLTTVGAEYEDKIKRLDDLLKSKPTKGTSEQATKDWFDQVESITQQINDPNILDNKQRAAYDRVFKQLHGLEADLAILDGEITVNEGIFAQLSAAHLQKMEKDILQGWTELQGLGVQVPKEIMDEWMSGIRKVMDRDGWRDTLKYYRAYTRFFKAWAIATPGFTVRNAMTAAFNNAVADVGFKNTQIGIEFAGKLARIRTSNTEKGGLTYALDWAERKYGKQMRDDLEKAYEAVLISGGGQAIDEVLPLLKRVKPQPVVGGKAKRNWDWTYNNALTRGQQRVNETVEIAARMGMALDAVQKGWDMNANAARIRRYHFDYSDLSGFDRTMKQIIPFWTFASRNVQLQMVNMITRPAMYRAYERVVDGGGDYDTILPEWMSNRNPIMLGADKVLMPDLPMVGLQEQINQLGGGGLSRVAAQSNPLIRAGIELLSGESAMFGSNLRRPVEDPVGISDRPAQALQNITRLWRGEEPEFNKYWQELLPSLLPPLSQLQRYLQPTLGAVGLEGAQDFVGGPERYKSRDFLTTFANYLGIPYRDLTDEELRKAVDSTVYQIEKIMREAKAEYQTPEEIIKAAREEMKEELGL